MSLWPNLSPAYTQSLTSQDVFSAPGNTISAVGGGGGVPSTIGPNLIVSTLTAAVSISTTAYYTSSINGTSWDYIVSTLHGLSPP